MDEYIEMNHETVEKYRNHLRKCLELLERYSWIIESFVLDFFLDTSLWLQFPDSWREVLSSASPASLASLLDPDIPPVQEKLWPLSLIAFKQSIHAASLNRHQVKDFKVVEQFLKENLNKSEEKELNENIELYQIYQPPANKGISKFEFYEEMFSVFSGHQSSLKHIFRKHVKPKKQYELARMGKFIKDTMSQIGEDKLIDVGAGVGHLARYLSYAHTLQVACVDANNDFTDAAKKFDSQLEESVRKLEDKLSKPKFQDANKNEGSLPDLQPASRPVHVTSFLQPDMDLHSFHSILAQKFSVKDDDLRYGIVGLHTCGDLAPVLVRMFCNDSKAVMLHSVGCCYMKIQHHFPMSNFLSSIKSTWSLSYTNAELACHAIEMYRERLRLGEQDKLKVHCYRATLEKILVNRDPNLRHTILKSVAKSHLIPFQEYAVKATSHLDTKFCPEDFCSPEISQELDSWWQVVVYYTIRLALAPVLETVILLDRSLALYESGHSSLLIPLFDPQLSPRNQILFAARK